MLTSSDELEARRDSEWAAIMEREERAEQAWLDSLGSLERFFHLHQHLDPRWFLSRLRVAVCKASNWIYCRECKHLFGRHSDGCDHWLPF